MQQKVVNDLEEQKEANETQTTKIFDDQQRLRENMKALKGSADEKSLLQRYMRQLNEQEDRLEALQKESDKLESQHNGAQEALDKMIRELSFDVRL
jgi:chaperonin cofactor prefoldin